MEAAKFGTFNLIDGNLRFLILPQKAQRSADGVNVQERAGSGNVAHIDMATVPKLLRDLLPENVLKSEV